MARKIIFENNFDNTGRRRTDFIYVHESLPICLHPNFAFDKNVELLKCTNCEIEFWFRDEKSFDKFSHRFIKDWNFNK